eukprot:1525602-Rhodomonas_salina.3
MQERAVRSHLPSFRPPSTYCRPFRGFGAHIAAHRHSCELKGSEKLGLGFEKGSGRVGKVTETRRQLVAGEKWLKTCTRACTGRGGQGKAERDRLMARAEEEEGQWNEEEEVSAPPPLCALACMLRKGWAQDA